MKWSKDDPLYYRDKLRDLTREAEKNNVKIKCSKLIAGTKIYFIGANGDTMSVDILDKE